MRPPDFDAPACPRCGTATARSRARTLIERARRAIYAKKLYRCAACGWRGWEEPFERAVPNQMVSGPLDLSELDSELAETVSGPRAGPSPQKIHFIRVPTGGKPQVAHSASKLIRREAAADDTASTSPRTVARLVKRTFDIVVSAIGLMVVAPILVLAAVAVRLESNGPALFRQSRVGLRFRRFTIFKLRTMRMSGSEPAAQVTSSRDPRITHVGRFLRRTKIDEFPQLWNVLRGDMSLVGPRPEVPVYVDAHADAYAEILTVRPGITDLASFTFRNEEEILAASENPETHYVTHVLPAKIALARDYVRRWSLAFDLEIIVKTVMEAIWLRALPEDGWLLRWRAMLVVALHLGLILGASYGAFWLRFDGDIPASELATWERTVIWLLGIRVAFLAAFRLFQGLWSYTSLHDLQHIVVAVLGSEFVFYVVVRIILGDESFPRSIFVLDAMLLIFAMSAVRLAKRVYASAGQLRGGRRALIVGSGERADFVIRAMRTQMLGDYLPVGLVTLSPGAAGRMHGVPVLGHLRNLKALIDANIADEVVLAYDRRVRGNDDRVMAALAGVSVPVRDAFQVMAAFVEHLTDAETANATSEAAAITRLGRTS